MKHNAVLCFVLAAAFLALFGCGKKEYASYELYAMDTFISFSVKDADSSDLAAAADTVTSIENTLSRTRENSEIYLLGHSKQADVSGRTADILTAALTLSEITDGAFNPCLGALSTLWDFTGTPYVPTDAELSALLEDTDPRSVSVSGTAVTKKREGTVIDLGACAKGYAAEAVAEILKARGIRSAMIDIGGNIAVLGQSPRGELWNVGVKNPFYPDTILGYVSCTDTVIAVSGSYERYFERDGILYHHILDPKTGKPAASGLTSVAVFCEDGLMCDALSTALFVMGKEGALDFYEKHICDFEAILVTDSGKVILTDGLKDRFVPNERALAKGGSPLGFGDTDAKNT